MLPAEPASVPVARRAVVAQLRRWRLDGAEDALALAVSELATNAVLHGRAGLRVVLARTPGGVRLEVGDDSPRLPQQRRHSALSGTGRGLDLVAALASGWGVESVAGGGKLVWAEFVLD